MTDVMERVNLKRVELAKRYTQEVIEQSVGILDVLEMLGDLEVFVWEGLKVLIEQKLEGEIFVSICGYTEWLANRLIRSINLDTQNPPDVQELPELNDSDFYVIVTKYRVKRSILKRTIARMTKPGTHLPLVGEINEYGNLVPDKDTLKQWAAQYGW